MKKEINWNNSLTKESMDILWISIPLIMCTYKVKFWELKLTQYTIERALLNLLIKEL